MKVESNTGNNVSWKSEAQFYADTKGNICDSDILICQAGYEFYWSNGKTDGHFLCTDINFRNYVKKSDALEFIENPQSKLKTTSLFFSLFHDSVQSYEFSDGFVCFIKIKGNELNQLIDMSNAKQKYSLAEYNKLHNQKN